jgi:hypothetical protein
MMCNDFTGPDKFDEMIASRTAKVLIADAPAPTAGWPRVNGAPLRVGTGGGTAGDPAPCTRGSSSLSTRASGYDAAALIRIGVAKPCGDTGI